MLHMQTMIVTKITIAIKETRNQIPLQIMLDSVNKDDVQMQKKTADQQCWETPQNLGILSKIGLTVKKGIQIVSMDMLMEILLILYNILINMVRITQLQDLGMAERQGLLVESILFIGLAKTESMIQALLS